MAVLDLDTWQGWLLFLLTLFFPPVGVYIVAGARPDLLINVVFTLFGYFPGLIHAIYVEHAYFVRKKQRAGGTGTRGDVPFIFSEHVQNGDATPGSRFPVPSCAV